MIPATRLMTTLGSRKEPVTYWTVVGDRVVTGSIQKKLVEMRFGMGGKIPDGMLIRVSSIDGQPQRAYELQNQFAESMVGAVAIEHRNRFIGAPQDK
jgi:EpsI family protein